MGSVSSVTDDEEGELPVGMMVGEYQIDGKLGEGGMGRVYSATHPVIAKRAAIKVLHPALSMNKDSVQRFVQEARSVNQIGHPNIVDIFAFGALPDGRHYFVMEYLRGESLRERIQRGGLGLDEALWITETITVALEAAHEKGIVHRDLKPDNVYLVNVKTEQPLVKLLDFGIAKLLGDQSRTHATQTGNLLGTPAYISPEQARGYAVDHRTDIYALGAMLFELMTGESAFVANNVADMLAKHLMEPPRSARAINPQVPESIDQLIGQMLAKEAERRPALGDVRAELRAWRRESAPIVGLRVTTGPQQHVTGVPSAGIAAPTGAVPTPLPVRTRSARGLVIALAALGAAGAGVAAFLLVRDPEPAAPGAAPAPAPAPTPAVQAPAPAPAPTVTPAEPTPPPAAEPAVAIPPETAAAAPEEPPPKKTRRKRTRSKPSSAPSTAKPQPTKPPPAPDDPDAPM